MRKEGMRWEETGSIEQNLCNIQMDSLKRSRPFSRTSQEMVPTQEGRSENMSRTCPLLTFPSAVWQGASHTAVKTHNMGPPPHPPLRLSSLLFLDLAPFPCLSSFFPPSLFRAEVMCVVSVWGRVEQIVVAEKQNKTKLMVGKNKQEGGCYCYWCWWMTNRLCFNLVPGRNFSGITSHRAAVNQMMRFVSFDVLVSSCSHFCVPASVWKELKNEPRRQKRSSFSLSSQKSALLHLPPPSPPLPSLPVTV